MQRKIQILPDAVANQIAAGEVVERPASVVKELLENALDAGARRVEIRIEGGGKRRIRVADDGAGMGREDALLSLDRHATSKIRRAEDLRAVATFGFRGEALSSIASVSRFTLETRAGGDEAGTIVTVRGGTVTAVRDGARTQGTTVLVEGLFFNAPARARFLRAPPAEARAVSEAVIPLALAHPEVEILLLSDERPLLKLPPGQDLGGRVAAIWGEEAASGLLAVEHAAGGRKLRGLVQRPDRARPGFRRAHLFVGGRPFRDASLLRAADRGYRTTIPAGHRPWLFLFLSTEPGAVDVNVHPTKAEVRFRKPAEIEELVEEGVRAALTGPESAATLESRPPAPGLVVRERGQGGSSAAREEAGQMAFFLAGDPSPEGDGEEGEANGAEAAPPAGLDRPRLWQAHASWILAEVRDGLLLIDQHAAHERILFERIMEGFEEGGEESQRLLFPITVPLTPAEVRMVEDLKGLLHRTGFEVEIFGEDAVILNAVPHPHPHFEAERCFREMVDELTHGSELVRAARNQHERVAMSFACKAAIKSGQALDAREIQELFDRLFATRLPYHDVHGRPTAVRLSRAELERKLGR